MREVAEKVGWMVTEEAAQGADSGRACYPNEDMDTIMGAGKNLSMVDSKEHRRRIEEGDWIGKSLDVKHQRP
jgi:hypothetical protein